jgi:hypothetical protein
MRAIQASHIIVMRELRFKCVPEAQPKFAIRAKDGGAEEIRTPDPHNAIVVLYQLSYDPIRKLQNKFSAPLVKTFRREFI